MIFHIISIFQKKLYSYYLKKIVKVYIKFLLRVKDFLWIKRFSIQIVFCINSNQKNNSIISKLYLSESFKCFLLLKTDFDYHSINYIVLRNIRWVQLRIQYYYNPIVQCSFDLFQTKYKLDVSKNTFKNKTFGLIIKTTTS